MTEQVIERIEERNPDLNAVVYKGYDDARRAASAADERSSSGAELGPLHGVPTLIKDLFDFKPGWKSTFGGIPVLADQVIDAYCVFAERVEEAGAIIVGKTNSPVMGFRGTCDNSLFGPSRNPFDTTKNTGGSSGGSAAAVADGFVPFAEGTDAGGSIRIPAAWCGVVRVQAVVGPGPGGAAPRCLRRHQPVRRRGPDHTHRRRRRARAVGTRRLRLARSLRLPDTPDLMAALDGDLRGKRVAYSPDFGVYPVDPRVAEVVAAAVRRSRRRARSSRTSTSRCRTTNSSSPTCGRA